MEHDEKLRCPACMATTHPTQRTLLTWRQNMKAMATMHEDRDGTLLTWRQNMKAMTTMYEDRDGMD